MELVGKEDREQERSEEVEGRREVEKEKEMEIEREEVERMRGSKEVRDGER